MSIMDRNLSTALENAVRKAEMPPETVAAPQPIPQVQPIPQPQAQGLDPQQQAAANAWMAQQQAQQQAQQPAPLTAVRPTPRVLGPATLGLRAECEKIADNGWFTRCSRDKDGNALWGEEGIKTEWSPGNTALTVGAVVLCVGTGGVVTYLIIDAAGAAGEARAQGVIDATAAVVYDDAS